MCSAFLKLEARGDSAVPFLTGKLKTKKVTVDAKRIATLLRGLDDNSFQTREKAYKELASIGSAAVPFLREALKNKPSPEVEARVRTILTELGVQAASNPAVLRRRWALMVLGQIASPRALTALKTLRAEANVADRPYVSLALWNLAERSLEPLLDAAGEQARQHRFATAVKLCGKALALAAETHHYSKGRIQAILQYLQVCEKAGKAPAKLPAELAAAAGNNGQAFGERIGWKWARGENLLGNAGFEVKQVQGNWPTAPGVWGGDQAEVVPAQQGIKPGQGNSMLRFLHGNFRSSGPATGAQVCQVIDLSKVKQAVRERKVRAYASVRFNRVAGDAQTDTWFSVSLIAYAGSPRQHFALSQSKASISREAYGLVSDANPATWQKLAISMRLPKNTDFLVIQLQAAEDIFNDLSGVEFDGHYADDTFVTLVTDPPAPAGR